MAGFTELAERGILAVGGDDRTDFLQGLLTNDLRHVGPQRVLYALLLTAQGRVLHDVFVADGASVLFLDGETARLADLQRRLTLYRLRSKVTLARREDLGIYAVFGTDALAALGLPEKPGAAKPLAGGLIFTDPRGAGLGARLIAPRREAPSVLAAMGLEAMDPADYDRLRLSLGIPDGSRDLMVEKALPIESGLDALNAISFDKGCYVGQELTARTYYRAPVRKRLMPVTVQGAMPESGTPILAGGTEAGRLFSGRDGYAMALLRLESVEKAQADGLPLTAGTAVVVPHPGER